MKLLLFSDLHADATAASRMVRLSREVDVVIGAGDFATARRGLSICVEVLRQIERPALLVPGNNESYEELTAACDAWPSATVLHGTGVELLGRSFFGLGGGVPVTPFGAWSYDFTEEEAARLLAGCPAGAVLISHSSPKGAVDLASDGRSLGSTAVREAITRVRPRLVVCGHIHASAGQQALLGQTRVINAGPAGMIWFLEE